MLGKLLKHEWTATRRILIPVNLTIILITIVGCIFLGTDLLQSENSIPLVILLIILYAISMIILDLVSTIYLLVRFYKNLFTAEGYLMFTLPVTPLQLLNAKLIVASLWAIFNTLLTMGSIFALSFSSGYYAAVHENSTDKGAFLSGFISALSNGAQDTASFQDIFGYTPVVLIFLCFILFLVSSFFSLTMGYLAITLGQLVEKCRVACSIVFYIALYIGTQITSSIILIVINLRNITGTATDSLSTTRSIYSTIFPASIILNLVLGILFYIITLILMRKKVNLE
ncbi:hypothetical protein [Roseburia sp. 499]|uniref:hypothetical protein n=1 Tax=Roseburia sp. 499 TaxID=1261634 RepID=UPI000952CB0E|nr:hypothetical protein [Roseburia sp. 499]WVK71119.1 hypothetical protein BIV20_06160 [Roseburia sp. 499]